MAGWYSSNYRFREPLTLFSAGGSQDFEIDIPSNWSLFWDNIQSTGYDIRVCANDGTTLLTFDRDGFDYANKVLEIEIDNLTISGTNPYFAWLYWGYASATDAVTAFVPASPIIGATALEAPPPAYTIVCGLEPPGATQPRNVITKQSGETYYIYWDVTDLLAKRETASEGTLMFEGINRVTNYRVLLAGVSQTSMRTDVTTSSYAGGYISNPLRVLEVNGRILIRTDIIGGTTNTDYTLELTFTMIFNVTPAHAGDTRTIMTRALLKVYDVSEV